jgi:two-component system, OmpR family, osmolarity sensor histidine kinase EnvZ
LTEPVNPPSFFGAAYERLGRRLSLLLPKGLFARSLIIIIAPIILLQGVVAAVFLERHWAQVTERLSYDFARNIAGVVDVYMSGVPKDQAREIMRAVGRSQDFTALGFRPDKDLPRPLVAPRFDLVNAALAQALADQVKRPFWLDTGSQPGMLEVRVLLDDEVLAITAPRSRAEAGNWHILLVWMVLSSFVLIAIAIIFLRNQIRPILRLADAAEEFGKGREHEYRPRGAREVRRAGLAFLEMKRRIARSIDQRTTMLNGVSHDLRTVLTRFNLSLAFIEPSSEIDALKRDVEEMNQMLDAYLAFAKGDSGERAQNTDLGPILEAVKSDAERSGHETEVVISGDPNAIIRPAAFKRLMANLVNNAARYGDRIEINAEHQARWLTVTVDDDGPGIPAEKRDLAFRPFHRLDEARTMEEGRSGLGLAIARDIARSHGGEITLSESPLGGLRATVRVPA